ncbi:MAG: hypothetical protein II179_00870 [Alphaproteobacteria bacterium]|nr:hypothetical protein [Alphaproteobacteria bacterium]
MNPKTLLITTVLGIATTAAFGAASLRAPQMGGTATVTTPTATNTARAGTMRTQTMKTSSVSAPSVTTTQSVATPVSTETTDARIALLKGIKGFNPGKIKDTTAATNELNTIDSRIEELQSKLDQAEAAADQTAKLTDVYTKEQVEAKIDEKLSQLGTSTDTKETYSKAEVDRLLAEKLPTVDANGNLNFTDSNGITIAQLLPYNLYSTHKYNDLASTQTYKLTAPHDFKTSSFVSLAQDYTRNWVSDICATERSNPDLVACGFYNANGQNTTMTEFNTISCFKGMHGTDASIKDNMVNIQYTTFEDLNETQINSHFCSDAQSDECSISEYARTPMGACAEKTFTLIETIERAMGQGGVVMRCSNPGCFIICTSGATPSGEPTTLCDCWRRTENGSAVCDDSELIIEVR